MCGLNAGLDTAKKHIMQCTARNYRQQLKHLEVISVDDRFHRNRVYWLISDCNEQGQS